MRFCLTVSKELVVVDLFSPPSKTLSNEEKQFVRKIQNLTESDLNKLCKFPCYFVLDRYCNPTYRNNYQLSKTIPFFSPN